MKMEEALYLERKEKDKFKQYFELMGLWMMRQKQNDSIGDYILEKGFDSVGIYGKGVLGELLFQELQECERLEVKYCIDRDKSGCGIFPEVITPEEISRDNAPQVIIVTPYLEYASIRNDLSKRCDAMILSLEDVIYFCGKKD